MKEEFIIHGPKPWKPLTNESLGKQLHEVLLKYVNLPTALVDAKTGKKVSYKVLLNKSCLLAESLHRSGFKQNDVLGICSENNLEFFIPVLAALYLGLIVTTFNPQYTNRELLHAASISKPKIVFCSKLTHSIILKAKTQIKCIKEIIVMDAIKNQAQSVSLEHFIQKHLVPYYDHKHFKPIAINAFEQVAFILYSSGTTGLPKGVMLTHNNAKTVISNIDDPRYAEPTEPGKQSVLGLMPFYHAYGLLVSLVSIVGGRSIVVLKAFEPQIFLKTIQDYNISNLYIAPPLANFLAKSPLVDKYDLSSVALLGCGASPLSKNVEKKLLQRLKVKIFRNAYGMTETTLGVTAFPLNERKAGSCGKIVPGVSAKVVDPSTKKVLGPNQIGEFYFKGQLVMKGYAEDVEATRNVIDDDGWLATGDVGYYDQNGYFYIVDRLKELIKYKGFQVPPAELEAILLLHPNIADAGVIGVPDEAAEELPLAFVVVKPNQNLTEEEVISFVAKQVSPQKQLRGGVKFVSEIPRNPSGKILRRILRELLQAPRSKL